MKFYVEYELATKVTNYKKNHPYFGCYWWNFLSYKANKHDGKDWNTECCIDFLHKSIKAVRRKNKQRRYEHGQQRGKHFKPFGASE